MRFNLGDWIQVLDGRVGTMVYNGPDGIGIKWGKIRLTNNQRDFILGLCPIFSTPQPEESKLWSPNAMLRDREYCNRYGYEFVGEEKDYDLVKKDRRNKRNKK